MKSIAFFVVLTTALIQTLFIAAQQQIPPVELSPEVIQPKAIIFDFGDVVAKTNRMVMVHFIAEQMGVSRAEAMRILNQYRDSSCQENFSEETFWKSIFASKRFGFYSEWIQKWEEIKLASIEEIPGTLDIVDLLKEQGYVVGLLSNVTKQKADLIRKKGLYDDFSPLLLSYEIGFEKPDPQAFQILLSTLNIPAEEIIFIDDKQENVSAARSFGIDGILFISAMHLQNELANRGITSTPESKQTTNRILKMFFP